MPKHADIAELADAAGTTPAEHIANQLGEGSCRNDQYAKLSDALDRMFSELNGDSGSEVRCSGRSRC